MQHDFIVLGTDTGVGKTTFCLLWLAEFSDHYEYWKPIETGDSDSETLKRLVPSAIVHAPRARFQEAVAPPLAARHAGSRIPRASELAAARPPCNGPGHQLLIETFGSPLSPLNDNELQIELARRLHLPTLLIGSSQVGAIGRVLQSLLALGTHNLQPLAVVLMGPPDDYAVQEIQRHGKVADVFSLRPPEAFDVAGIARAASQQRATLTAIRKRCGAAWESRQSSRAPTRILDSLVQRDRQTVWHPYSSLRDPDPPLVVESAKDEYFTLADGRRVIDGISSWWTILHGHRHPVLMQALADAAARYDHVLFAGVTHPHAVELAELMLSTLPWQGGRVFYSDDGSTAVEVALKMAYQFWCHRGEPNRKLFVGFEDAYHGDTFGAMAVGRDPIFFGHFEPLLFRAERVPLSPERLEQRLRSLSGQVAAVIIEPLVQGAGGMKTYSPEILRAIYQLAREHDVLFIVDEVMTGGGRTGDLWAHQTAGIVPDLICAGKTIAGGVLPIAATLAAPNIVAAFDSDDRSRTFFHGHSFTAHPLACAVGAANWRMISQGVAPIPANMEQFWTERLSHLRDHRRVKDVRIRGTIAAIELDASGGYLANVARSMRQATLERGVFLRPLGNVLYSMPPLCTSKESLEQIASAMEHAIESIA